MSWRGDRIHLSAKPLGPTRRVAQQRTQLKPTGIWYACGYEWIRWLQGEQPDWLAGVRHAYLLDVDARELVVLDTLGKLDDFDAMYGFGGRDREQIDWAAVAQLYGGVEICPYQRQRRMSLFWYYAWDVASGVIWSPRALVGAREVDLDDLIRKASR